MANKTNCVKNGKKYYRVYLDLGRDSNGKRIRKEFYGVNKKDAEAKLEQYKNGLNAGLATNYDTLTLGNVCKLWLFEKVKNTVKPSTFERYEGIYRLYIEPSQLYPIKLKDLKSLDLQRYYNDLFNAGKSSNVIKNLNKLLRNFFNYCLTQGYIVRNYCSGVDIPQDNSLNEDDEDGLDDIVAFTIEEQNQFIRGIKGHRLEALFILALSTGLRQGELLGLKWADIDFSKKELHVKRAIRGVYLFDGDKKHYELIETPPKTKNSVRSVPIPENVIPILKKRELNQKKERLKAGDAYIKNDYLFSTQFGTPTGPSNLRKMYNKILAKNNIPHKKFHSLRHTYATRLFEAGVSLKTVQMLLGHADIQTTLNVYVHVMPEQKLKAVDKINNLFNIK
ncbi:site-specific integrase [Clostridium sp. WLY-B-L2]|uniref:Site-specific integrase n=1 Tax=Clostridium aromativorans TaxID=2836848 RepID=A0ABS8N3M0_9CLOT|nr:site-specific integrase [Clostridium aromativorans]MCC9294388.1 site-specific integrase [Clostridium aromativorans]